MSRIHPAVDERRASILEAARRLLIRHGYQDFVLDDLAREAGVAKGTLFLYFKSKDELLASTFAELVDQIGAELQELEKAPLEGRPLLESAVRTVLAHFDRNSDFLSQFGVGRFPSCSDRSCGKLMDKFAANTRRMGALIRRSALVSSKEDPESSAVFLFGLCRSMFLYNQRGHRSPPLEERTRFVVDRFLHGWAA